MLIEFRLRNFRSVREEQVFSMVAGPGKELPDNLCPAQCDLDLSLVRSAVLYGPNASGKSNWIRALDFMKNFVVSSAKESQKDEKIPVENFAFDTKTDQAPSKFEVTFSKNSTRYQYGFVVDQARVYEEWLFAYPLGRVQELFCRKYNEKSEIYDWEFSKYFRGNKQTWKKATRENSLFLSTIIQLNNQQMADVFDWFQKDLIVITNTSNLKPKINFFQTPETKLKVIEYMQLADPSIVEMIDKLIEEYAEVGTITTVLAKVKAYQEKIIKDAFFKKEEAFQFLHKGSAQKKLNLSEESLGTQKCFAFANYWVDALENGRVLVIDELDTSLHPLVAEELVKRFCDSKENKQNAQLIFSTHNTALLDNDIFRRDQVWFFEKEQDHHSTHLYPLLEFSPRKKEPLQKGYLEGRYGALPFVGEWKFS